MVDRIDEVSQLIERALTLADELGLSLTSIQLEEARIALKKDNHAWTDAPEAKSALPAVVGGLGGSHGGGEVVQLRDSVSLQQLLREHETLDLRRESLLLLVRGKPEPSEAWRQLTEFKALIEAHRATERRCVYGPLEREQSHLFARLHEKLTSLTGEIERDWKQYLYYWDEGRIASRWSNFALATNIILTRAGDRMRLEERVIYPLAFLGGNIELKQAAS